MRNVTPEAKKRVRIDEFAFPAHVPTPTTSANATQEAKANDEIVSTSASEHDSYTSASEYEPEPSTKRRALRSSTKKEEIITPEIVSAIDRCGLSNDSETS